jgi:hypothetical protein
MPCELLADAEKNIEAVLRSEVTPVVLDLHNLSPASRRGATLVLGFAGSRQEVDWQLKQIAALGIAESSSLNYEAVFHPPEFRAPHRMSVLPSRLVEALHLIEARLVARAGNGVIYYRGEKLPHQTDLPLGLFSRVKQTYDPNHILPELAL